MKKAIAVVAALAWTITPANADVYVKVDANGNAIGGAIVCEASVCGNPDSSYSRATLGQGEQYVLQGLGTTGVGNNNPNTILKVDVETQIWTKITPDSVSTFSPNNDYQPTHINLGNPLSETSTIINDTATVLSDTRTTTIDTTTAINASTTFESLYAQVMALLTQILALIAKLNG